MALLPDWLKAAQHTVPQWIRKVGHDDGPGRYRFALDAFEPYDLDSSCLAAVTRLNIEGMLPEAERREWADYLLGMQEPTEGWLVDKAMERHIVTKEKCPTAEEVFAVHHWTTRNGLTTVIELGGRPRYPIAHKERFHTREETEAYLTGLDWHTPWGAGSWAGALIWYHRINQMLGDESASVVIGAAVDWLARRQDPDTGAWSDGSDVRLHRLLNGIFKVWIQAIPASDFPVQYPEKVIDLCLRALREDPALVNTPDACSIFDVALVLDVALHLCDHRRDEVAELAVQALPRLEPLYREDGAFSYGPGGSLASHGGLQLAPVKMQSDAAGTAIVVSAISLLCNLCGLCEEIGWTPTTESRMGLKTPWEHHDRSGGCAIPSCTGGEGPREKNPMPKSHGWRLGWEPR